MEVGRQCVYECPRLIACRDEGRGRQSEGADDRSAVGSWRLEVGVWRLERGIEGSGQREAE